MLPPSLLTLLRTCRLTAEGVKGMQWDLTSASAVGMAAAVMPLLESSWRLCQSEPLGRNRFQGGALDLSSSCGFY